MDINGHTKETIKNKDRNMCKYIIPEGELSEETLIEEFHTIKNKCFDEGIEGWQREKLIARHFYELGLNARKEK